jgi:phospholipid-binding lipoprotein MlaA
MRCLIGLVLLGSLTGCATPANHYDPLEPLNRRVYSFNRALDESVVKPVAQGYVDHVPSPARTAVSNFFSNIEDVYIGANKALQGKLKEATSDLSRVLFNSTLGLFGLIDLATPAGLPKHQADLGQTLGQWGIGSGPYLVVPFLGSKTLRDTSDWVGARALDPLGNARPAADYGGNVLRMLDRRASLLRAGAVIDAAAIDEYSFVRDAYLQRRWGLVWDGAPPAPLKLGDDADDFSLDELKGDMQAPAAPQSEPPHTAPAATR